MKKTILFYTMTLNFGGAEKNICALANHFVKNYNVILVSNIKSIIAYKLDSNIKIYQFDNNDSGLLKIKAKLSSKRTKELQKIVKKDSINLIIAFLPEPSIRALQIAQKMPIPVIIGIRSHPQYEFVGCKFLRDYYYQNATYITIQHQAFASFLPRKYHDKLVITPNVSPNCHQQGNKKNIILNIGRLESPKNHKLLIESFKIFLEKHPDFKLHIYGEGTLKKDLNHLVSKLALQDKVFIFNNTQEVSKKISESKLFVLSFKYEGMPNVVLESLYLKTPVVSTKSTPVMQDLILPKYISDFTPQDLALKMDSALKHYQFRPQPKLKDSFLVWEELINNIFYK